MQIGNVFMSNRLSLFASDGTRDLQTGRQRDDDGYSHNDIPGLVQKKWIIKSPAGVRDIVLVLFTTAKQRFLRLQCKHVKTRQVKLQICSAEAFLTIRLC
jgi:hypothetical protein